MSTAGTDFGSFPISKGADDKRMEILLVTGFEVRRLLYPQYSNIHIMSPGTVRFPNLRRLLEVLQNLPDNTDPGVIRVKCGAYSRKEETANEDKLSQYAHLGQTLH